MTSFCSRGLLAFAMGGLLLSAPANAGVTPYSTMWGFKHCPDETVDWDQSLQQDQERQANADALHLPEQINFDDMPRFCKAHSNAVLCAGTQGGGMLTLAQVYGLDLGYRMHFKYRSDLATANRDDYWRNWTVCGDCEDYSLSMSEILARNGVAGENMQLQLMDVDDGENGGHLWVGHATLWVTTSDAGVVEISVGKYGNPHPLVMKSGKRMATIRMDGFQTVEPLPGYHVNMQYHTVTANTP